MSHDELVWYEDFLVARAAEAFELLTRRQPSAQARERMRETTQADTRFVNNEDTPDP